MPKAPPYFPFFYNDWLGGVATLTPQQEQCYLRLLIQQWQDGMIPSRTATRSACCNVENDELWSIIWDAIKDKFEPFDIDDTRVGFRNPRLHEERERAIKAWNQRRSASKKGGDARKRQAKAGRVAVRLSVREAERVAERIAVSYAGARIDFLIKPALRTEEDIKKVFTSLEGLSDSLILLIHEWVKYKSEKSPPERYTPTGFVRMVQLVKKRVEEFGEEEVARHITEAMAAGWKGWDHGEWHATQTETFREV